MAKSLAFTVETYSLQLVIGKARSFRSISGFDLKWDLVLPLQANDLSNAASYFNVGELNSTFSFPSYHRHLSVFITKIKICLFQMCGDYPECLYWTYNYRDLFCHMLRSLDGSSRIFRYGSVSGPRKCSKLVLQVNTLVVLITSYIY